MIRRRSCINNIRYDINISQKFSDLRRKKIFRNSVKFKRYHFKGTKFKRRHIRKLRHNAIWPLHYNVFKYWTDDIRFVKQYARFQYHHRFFHNNSILIHGNTWAARRNHVFIINSEWVSSSMTKKLFLTRKALYEKNSTIFQLSNHYTFTSYQSEIIEGDIVDTPLLSIYDNQTFVNNNEKQISLFDIFQENFFFNFITINQLSEFYKILTILWYLQIIK